MIFIRLNVPIAEHKSHGLGTVMECLHVVLDSKQMQTRLPAGLDMLQEFRKKRSCTKRERLQVLGQLNFASRVIKQGRSFVSYIIKLSASVRELHHHIHFK